LRERRLGRASPDACGEAERAEGVAGEDPEASAAGALTAPEGIAGSVAPGT